MSSVRSTVITMALLTPVLAGCGEGEEASRAGAPTAAPTVTATHSAVPTDLAGAWQVAVKHSELPENEPKRRAGSDEEIDVRIEFHATGGPKNGPTMTVDFADEETFVLAISVKDGEISIEDFVECRTFAYAVEAERLTFEAPRSSCARRHTLPAILAARPWRRA